MDILHGRDPKQRVGSSKMARFQGCRLDSEILLLDGKSDRRQGGGLAGLGVRSFEDDVRHEAALDFILHVN